jgi:hypothetical protein
MTAELEKLIKSWRERASSLQESSKYADVHGGSSLQLEYMSRAAGFEQCANALEELVRKQK